MLKTKLLAICLGVAAAAFLSSSPASADLDLPRPSPFAKVSQDVGLTTITVDYSSPGVKGRKIWGGLVPYGQMWRTGANVATKVSFSKDVTFAGKPVPAGTYALFTIPTAGDWTVILNKKADQPGTGQGYKAEEDLLRVTLKPKAAPFRERLAFLVTDFTDDKAQLALEWEKLRLTIPVETGTTKQALANIASTIDNNWRVYANAARYLAENKLELDVAMKYADQSIALKEDWYNVWIKAQVLAAKGNYKEALPLAQRANELGTKAGNFFFEADVKKALVDWKKKG
jgi:hypothetical protein